MIYIILCENLPSEEAVESFVDLLCVLKSGKVYFAFTQTLIRGICLSFKRFMENKALCVKLISMTQPGLPDEDSKASQPQI